MIMACAGPPPSGRNLKTISNDVPSFVQIFLNLVDTIIKWWFWRSQINYDSVLMKSDGKDLEQIKGWVEEGRIRPAVGKVLKFGNLEGIKEEGMRIMKGKGGVGKVVVSIIMD
jgi:NADPH:quinone reductase-like Zn-dependent oxidoreductase